MLPDKGYLAEKGSNALRDIGRAFATLDRTDLAIDELRAEVRSDLCNALYNLTKVLAHVTTGSWSVDDADKVAKNPRDGIESLLVQYGWLDEKQTAAFRIRDAGAQILKLSREPRSPARTLMHEQLSRIPVGTPPFDQLRDVLEQVTQGERSWADLQAWCAECLTEYDGPAAPAKALQGGVQ